MATTTITNGSVNNANGVFINAGNANTDIGSSINMGNSTIVGGLTTAYVNNAAVHSISIITGATIPLATGYKMSLVGGTQPANYITKKTHYFAQTFSAIIVGGPGSLGETGGGTSVVAGTGIGYEVNLRAGAVFLSRDGLYYNQETNALVPPTVFMNSSGITQIGTKTTVLGADKTADDGWSDAGQVVINGVGYIPTEVNI